MLVTIQKKNKTIQLMSFPRPRKRKNKRYYRLDRQPEGYAANEKKENCLQKHR